MHALTLSRRLAPLALGAVVVASCGARTPLDTTVGADVELEPHPPCESASGVRICGGTRPCPTIPAPECPGYGCTAGFDFESDAGGAGGICFADLPDLGGTPCYACPDGEECIARGPDDLVCVPPDVCDALWDEGIRDVCFYADKSRYDHRPVPAPASDCPSGGSGVLCGGGCGDCPTPPENVRCTGRSPGRAHGLCALDSEHLDPNVPGAFEPCSLPPVGAALTWCNILADGVCAVFAHDDPVEEALAKRNAFCISRAKCVSVSGSGGIECYDKSGTRIAP